MVGSGDWTSLGHELTSRLRGLVEHCALRFKDFNLVTVLRTVFVLLAEDRKWNSHELVPSKPLMPDHSTQPLPP